MMVGANGESLALRMKKAAETKMEKKPPVERLVLRWNAVVEALQEAEHQWEEMQKLLLHVPRSTVQLAPPPVQKALARFRKAKFSVMLERLVEHYRAYGGLEKMKVKETNFEKEVVNGASNE